MQLRSAISYEGIAKLQFRIELPAKATETYKSDKHIVRDFNEAAPMLDTDHTDDEATFARPCADTEYDVSISADLADHYRRNFAFEVQPDKHAIVQLGYNGADKPRHLRMTFDRFMGHRDSRLRHLLSQLRGVIGGPQRLSTARLTIENLEASYLIKGLGLNDVNVTHHEYVNATTEVIRSWEQEDPEYEDAYTCGYEFGPYLDNRDEGDDGECPVTKPAATAHTNYPYDWPQHRMLALRDIRPWGGDLPMMHLKLVINKPARLFELEARNPLAGMEICQATEEWKGLVSSWEPGKAWRCLLDELAFITSDER